MPKDRTQNNLENNLDGFERVLRALILAGMDPKDAVKVAYHRYPVMRHLYKDLLDDLVGDFAEGYGKKKAAAKFEREAISAAMKKSWTDDGVNLSERMYKNSKKIQAESAEVIGKAIKEGESAAKTAKKLFDGYGKGGIIPEQDIPEFIQEVKDLPVPDWLDEEAVAEWKAAIRHARKLIEQGTTPGLRAAYSEVMDAIENGAKQNVSKAIDTAVQEKTRYTAERIARTERARAYADGVMAKYLDDPDIVAFQWKLSDRHPKCDICDVYAHADLYGLGKGIFPKDKFPKLPAHPHCLCRIKPIVDGMIDMSRQKDNVDKGGKAYIDTLPKREQERLLGVHGKKDVMGGKKEWLTSARGVSKEDFEVRKPVPKGFEDHASLVIPKGKIIKYCLNKEHVKGGPKAVAFEKYLGYTQEKADEFEAFIRNSIKQSEIKHVHTDKYGSKYESISYVTTLDGERIQMITAWIIGHGENAPRLITAYLKPEIKE